MTLQEMLSTVEDPRSQRGLRHPLSDVLLMCIISMMSGCCGYRETGRFLKRNRKEFQQALRLLHKVPSCVTVREVLQTVDFARFYEAFNQWALQFVPMCKGNTRAVDGKATAGTVSDYFTSCQNFVSTVSIFATERGIVLSCSKTETGKESEIPTVQQLIRALDVQGEIFTADALHCQKKH